MLQGYNNFELVASAQVEEERFKGRVDEIVLNLSAQAAAMKAIEQQAR